MQIRTFALEPGGLPRLSVEALPGRFRLTLDGEPLGEVDPGAALEAEPLFSLPDGSILRVAPSPTQASGELPFQLTRNGRPLPQRAKDPALVVRGASQLLYALAATVGLLTMGALAGSLPRLEGPLMLGRWSGLAAIVLAGCGLGVGRRSRGALGAAMAVLVAFGLAGAARAVNSSGAYPLWPVPLWLLGVVPLSRALQVMRR